MKRRAGTFILVITLLLWFLLAWLGWALVFASSEASAQLASGSGTSFADRILFAGQTLVGGASDLAAGSGGWRVAALAATAHGLFLASLSIAYLIPVVSAVAEKRKLAGHIATLGRSPDEIVVRAWNGRDFGDLNLHLVNLVPEITLLAQRHLAYPLVHHFHSSARYWACAPAVAALDEAMTMLSYGVPREHRPDAVALRTARAAVLELLETLQEEFLDNVPDPPPPPDLEVLREYGVPVHDDGRFQDRLDVLAPRRALLRAMVEQDGWAWDEVAEGDPTRDPSLDDTFDPAQESPLRPVG
jgi:hypothetical protein